MGSVDPAVPDLDEVRDRFEGVTFGTVGLEEEVLMVDPRTSEPLPLAQEVVVACDRPEVVTEVPAAQVELVTAPHRSSNEAAADLAGLRRLLASSCAGTASPIAAAVHPTSPAAAVVGRTARTTDLRRRYPGTIEQQAVGALQVHVAVPGADLALAAYNALRSYLPELTALAAAAPFHEGRDTQMASVRPQIAGLLPRQGVPPPITSWEAFLDDLRWGVRGGALTGPACWWWELRPHVRHGTLEVRVPDVQPTVRGAGAVASVVRALVGHVVDRLDGDGLGAREPHPSWRIAENRWLAARSGVHGELLDLDTGWSRPTRRVLLDLLDRIEPHGDTPLDAARELVERGAADQLREVGVDGAAAWLARRFLEGTEPSPRRG